MNIELSAVAKRFGKVHALRDVTLSIPAGTKVALIGPNGSGKTTLIRVLLGLVEHRGEVRIDGVPREQHADRIAYVPQIAPQLAASCGELVRAIAELRRLEIPVVQQIAARLDLSLAGVEARPFRSLSGGSKQKLLLALALASRPALLVLDEPTASLDAAARGKFFELQRELARDATLVLCSHRIEEIRSLVDHVVVLADGRVVYDGDAARYLRRRLGSVVEVRATHRTEWLAAHEFVRGVGGWWTRHVDRAAKLQLVPALLAALGDDALDLVVRDLDLVEHEARGIRVAA